MTKAYLDWKILQTVFEHTLSYDIYKQKITYPFY